jgi:hypothetical protein
VKLLICDTLVKKPHHISWDGFLTKIDEYFSSLQIDSIRNEEVYHMEESIKK